MKLIVGLGNPGRKYENTRHNVGFGVAARLAQSFVPATWRRQFDGETCDGQIGDQRVVLLCPQTYMNASGRSVRRAADFYRTPLEDILIVCDCLNLPLGRLRIRPKGSAGGQKGLADVIQALQDDRVPRLRIGIDPPPAGWAVPDYVLSKFKTSEMPVVDEAMARAAEAAAAWATQGIDHCMNVYNRNND